MVRRTGVKRTVKLRSAKSKAVPRQQFKKTLVDISKERQKEQQYRQDLRNVADKYISSLNNVSNIDQEINKFYQENVSNIDPRFRQQFLNKLKKESQAKIRQQKTKIQDIKRQLEFQQLVEQKYQNRIGDSNFDQTQLIAGLKNIRGKQKALKEVISRLDRGEVLDSDKIKDYVRESGNIAGQKEFQLLREQQATRQFKELQKKIDVKNKQKQKNIANFVSQLSEIQQTPSINIIKTQLDVKDKDAKKIQEVIISNIQEIKTLSEEIKQNMSKGIDYTRKQLENANIPSIKIKELLEFQKKQQNKEVSLFNKYGKDIAGRLELTETVDLFKQGKTSLREAFKVVSLAKVNKITPLSQEESREFKKLPKNIQNNILAYSYITTAKNNIPSVDEIKNLIQTNQTLSKNINKNLTPTLKKNIFTGKITSEVLQKPDLSSKDRQNLRELRKLSDAEVKDALINNKSSKINKYNDYIKSFNRFYENYSRNERKKLTSVLQKTIDIVVKEGKSFNNGSNDFLKDIPNKIKKAGKILAYSSISLVILDKIKKNRSISLNEYKDYVESTTDLLGVKSLNNKFTRKVRENFKGKSKAKGILLNLVDAGKIVKRIGVNTAKYVLETVTFVFKAIPKVVRGGAKLSKNLYLDTIDYLGKKLGGLTEQDKKTLFRRTAKQLEPAITGVKTASELLKKIKNNPSLLILGGAIAISLGIKGTRKIIKKDFTKLPAFVLSIFLEILIFKGLVKVTGATLKQIPKVSATIKKSKEYQKIVTKLGLLRKKSKLKISQSFRKYFPKLYISIQNNTFKPKTFTYKGSKILIEKSKTSNLYRAIFVADDVINIESGVKRASLLRKAKSILDAKKVSKFTQLSKYIKKSGSKFIKDVIDKLPKTKKKKTLLQNLVKNPKRIKYKGFQIFVFENAKSGINKSFVKLGDLSVQFNGLKRTLSLNKAKKYIDGLKKLKLSRLSGYIKDKGGKFVKDIIKNVKNKKQLLQNFIKRPKKNKYKGINYFIFEDAKTGINKGFVKIGKLSLQFKSKKRINVINKIKDAIDNISKIKLKKLKDYVKITSDTFIKRLISNFKNRKILNLKIRNPKVIKYKGDKIFIFQDTKTGFKRGLFNLGGKITNVKATTEKSLVSKVKKLIDGYNTAESSLKKSVRSASRKDKLFKMFRNKRGSRQLLVQIPRTETQSKQTLRLITKNTKELKPIVIDLLKKRTKTFNYKDIINNIVKTLVYINKVGRVISYINSLNIKNKQPIYSKIKTIPLSNFEKRRISTTINNVGKLNIFLTEIAQLKLPNVKYDRAVLSELKKIVSLQIPKLQKTPPKRIKVPKIKFKRDFRKNPPKNYNYMVNGRIRVKGKNKIIKLETTLNRALKYMVSLTDNTLARSFDLLIVGITKAKDVRKPSLRKFRRKLSKSGQVLSIVEKSKYAIDTVGEKTGLTVSKYLKGRKTNKRKKKPKKKTKKRKTTKRKKKKR